MVTLKLSPKACGYLLQLVAADMERMRHHADHARSHGMRDFSCAGVDVGKESGDELVLAMARVADTACKVCNGTRTLETDSGEHYTCEACKGTGLVP